VDFLIIILVGFAAMWFLIVLPQRRRQSAHQRMIAALQTGDEIVTAGGLYGRVRWLGDDEVKLEIAPGVEVRVAKAAVAAVRGQDEVGRASPIDEVRG
jgi:preprotein translocase subunit YajC